MRLSFWRGGADTLSTEPQPPPDAAARAVTHRQFLRLVLGVVGGAGLGLAGSAVRRAEATYTPGSPSDTVDTNLTVQGNLIVVSGANGPGNVGVGTSSPQGKLDVAGEVCNGSIVLLDGQRRGRQCYFADATPLMTGPGSWGVIAHYTWGELLSKNLSWGDLGTMQ